ncbi:hypothetical protein Tco_0017787 [Tanacetum coccineum]
MRKTKQTVLDLVLGGTHQRVELLKNVFLRWVFQRERHFASSTTSLKVNHIDGSNAYITKIANCESIKDLNVSVGTLLVQVPTFHPTEATFINAQMTFEPQQFKLRVFLSMMSDHIRSGLVCFSNDLSRIIILQNSNSRPQHLKPSSSSSVPKVVPIARQRQHITT